MSTKDLKALARRFFDECNKGKAVAIAVLDELYATDVVFHNVTGKDYRGLKDRKQSQSELFSAYPDAHWTIDDMLVEGEKIAVRYMGTGTHTGSFMGIPPTNKKITYWAIEINRLSDGKIVESWSRTDTLSLMQQLGLVPKQGQD